MKRLLFLAFAWPLLTFGQTTTIDFEDDSKWVGGSGYGTKSYDDGNFESSSNDAFKETSAGFCSSGVRAYRVDGRDASAVWNATVFSGGVGTFSVMIRQWDDSPASDMNFEYSIDGGSNWVLVAQLQTGGNLSDNYASFGGTINSTNSNILFRVQPNGAGERYLIDDFTWTAYACSGPVTLDTLACNSYTSPAGNVYNTPGQYSFNDTLSGAGVNGCDSIISVNLTLNADQQVSMNVEACDSFVTPSEDTTYYAAGSYVIVDTIPTANSGCDSIITINLELRNSTSVNLFVNRCDSFVAPSGTVTYYETGNYTDVIQNAAGCDSTININLTIRKSTRDTIAVDVCDSYLVPSQSFTITTSGTYTDIIQNNAQCDSIITIHATIRTKTFDTVIVEPCETYTTPNGNGPHTQSGIYFDTLSGANAAGCDSIIAYDVRMKFNTTNALSVTECTAYQVPSGDSTYTTVGNYTVMDTIANAAGCDSILTIDITIIGPIQNTISVEACDSYTVPSGDETYTESGQYQDTIPSVNNCDSVLTIDLTILNKSFRGIVIDVCDSFVAPSNPNKVFYTSGTKFDTLVNSIGCDSVLFIDLTIRNKTFDTIAVTRCDTYTTPTGSATYTSSGTYFDTTLNSVNCDSITVINLTILESTTDTIQVTVCDTYTAQFSGAVYDQSGLYTDLTTNAAGCDSVIVIDLTILESTTETISPVACDSFELPSQTGFIYVSGTYMDTIQNVAGCDSVITIMADIRNADVGSITTTNCNFYVTPSNDTLTQSGTFLDTIQTVGGCDSIITIDLTIITEVTSNLIETRCESYVSPSGATFDTTGIYLDTIPSAEGCDSIITIDLTILDATSQTVVLDSCDSISVNGETYYQTGIYTQLFTNAVGCDSTLILDLTVSATPDAPIALGDGIFCEGDKVGPLHAEVDEEENLIITGVMDGPLGNGEPRVVELFAKQNIANLGEYALGSANNGVGTDGAEYFFPDTAIAAGTKIYVSSSAHFFNVFFGQEATFIDSSATGPKALAINGDDAIELFRNEEVVDVFGLVTYGTFGTDWFHKDGWAYRNNDQSANGGTFDSDNWTYSGENALDNEVNNATAATPFPIGTYESFDDFQFTWYSDANLTDTISDSFLLDVSTLGLGTVQYFVTNNLGGCISVADSTAVTINSTPTLSIVGVDATANPANGSIDLTVTNGTSPFDYQWSNGPTTEDQTNVGAGNYVVVVTDANGCSATDTVALRNVANVQEIENITFEVYPNPSSDKLFVVQNQYQTGRIWITDLNGKILFQSTMTAGEKGIDISKMAKGHYRLFIDNGTTIGNAAFVKD